MARFVTTTYRYKRPPRKRAKAAAIEALAIVTAKSGRLPLPEKQAAAEGVLSPNRAITPNTPSKADREPAVTAPAIDDHKPAIVTTISRQRLKLLRPQKRATEAKTETSPKLKEFLACMVRPGGALPPPKR
jgi:hypothetical protein